MKTKLLLPFLFICVLTYAQFPTNGLIAYHDFSNGSLLDQANGNNFTQTGSNLTTLNVCRHMSSLYNSICIFN